jgi:hypothetical protein
MFTDGPLLHSAQGGARECTFAQRARTSILSFYNKQGPQNMIIERHLQEIL